LAGLLDLIGEVVDPNDGEDRCRLGERGGM